MAKNQRKSQNHYRATKLVVSLLMIGQFGHSLSLSLKSLIGQGVASQSTKIDDSDLGTSPLLDDTFCIVADIVRDQENSTASEESQPTDAKATIKTPLVLAQTNTHVERLDLNKRAVSVIQSYDRDMHRAVKNMFIDGYWVVVCDELRASENPTDLAYFTELNHSNQVYTRLAKDKEIRNRLFSECKFTDEEIQSKTQILKEMKIESSDAQLDDSHQMWTYRKPNEIVNIKGKFSKDLSLFYRVEDVRSLFNWRRPLYHNICKFLSQQYIGYSSLAVKKDLDLLMAMQSVLTELAVYNLITEDSTTRQQLYDVCRASQFPIVAKGTTPSSGQKGGKKISVGAAN